MIYVKKTSTFLACVLGFIFTLSNVAIGQESEPDLLSFAHGALPVLIDTGDANLRVGMEHAIAIIDGNPGGFVATLKPATTNDSIEIVYELPAPTRFNRFAVPNVLETPSPSQTFIKTIEVWGSVEGPDGEYAMLAHSELSVHEARGQVTELSMAPDHPEVRWVSLRLRDGINIETEKSFLEFSELIGNGVQQEPELSDTFSGVWAGRGVKLELKQDRTSVSGCYDTNGIVSGTVEGRVLRALGKNDAGIASQFILIATDDGSISGLRSTNGAPFKPYNGEASTKAPVCLPKEPASLGCGSIVHGIGFNFDSADIRPSSQPIITSLYEGLAQENVTSIEIIGHSSSEGAEGYNRDLSKRRAASVVATLVKLGLGESLLSASGRGEDDPIASNNDEAGRSLNRRVEIKCVD